MRLYEGVASNLRRSVIHSALSPSDVALQRFFSLQRLAIFFCLWLAMGIWYWSSLAQGDPIDRLSSPKDTLLLVCERDLSYYDGIAETAPSWRQFNYWLFGTPAAKFASYDLAFKELISWYQDQQQTANSQDLLSIHLSHLILLAENDQVEKALSSLPSLGEGERADISQRAFRHAYDNDTPISQSDWAVVSDLLGEGWFANHLLLRSAEQFDDLARIEKYKHELIQEASTRITQSAIYLILAFVPIVLGLIFIGRFFSHANNRTVNNLSMRKHHYFSAWSLFQGAGIFFRSQIWWMGYFLVLSLLLTRFYWLYDFNFLWIWGGLLAALPMLYLMHKYLLQPRQLTLVSAFGLSPSKFGYWRLVKWSAALLAIDAVLNMIIGWLLYRVGYQSPLLESVSEYLLWSSPIDTILEMISVVVWAPLLEEILFRGLVYLSLRAVLRPVPAIIISAAIFSALHFYSFVGFVSVFIAGAIWAWAYERCRSLLPGIIAHSFSNLFWAITILLYYR